MEVKDYIIEKYSVSPPIAEVLVKKGVTTPELADATFEPDIDNLVHWSTLPDIEKLLQEVERIKKEKKKILVWGHEDADGFTSVGVLLRILHEAGIETHYYIPSKNNEGHGLSDIGLKYARDIGISTIVTVDIGGSDVEGVKKAKDMGFNVIVTDHHELPETTPDCPIINPKIGGGSFPYLAGVGVSMKVAWAITERILNKDLHFLLEYHPQVFVLTMIGTAADRVPPFSENRIILNVGENELKKSDLPFVRALRRVLNNDPTIGQIISVISSGQRDAYLHTGVELLMLDDEEKATEMVTPMLSGVEEYRKKGEELLFKAQQQIWKPRKYLLIDLRDAEPKYLGFVASQLKDQYKVPTIVLGSKGDYIVSEVRAPYGFDSLELLKSLSHLFVSYGGHKAASGFSMPSSNLSLLVEEVESYFRNHDPDLKQMVDFVEETPDEKILSDMARLGALGVEIRMLTKFKSSLLQSFIENNQMIEEGKWVIVSSDEGKLTVWEP